MEEEVEGEAHTAHTDSEQRESIKQRAIRQKGNDETVAFPFSGGMKPLQRREERKVTPILFFRKSFQPIQVSALNSLPSPRQGIRQRRLRGGEEQLMPRERHSSLLHPRENRWHQEISPEGPTHLPGIPGF